MARELHFTHLEAQDGYHDNTFSNYLKGWAKFSINIDKHAFVLKDKDWNWGGHQSLSSTSLCKYLRPKEANCSE